MKGSENRLISIIMPAYNSALYIAAAIESVLKQTYPNWELLIIDDGSTDFTKNIVDSFLEKDERIQYFHQQNAGQAKARNVGITKSRFSLIAFIDSDDLWLPNMLEFSLSEFEKGDQDVLFSNSYLFNDGEDYSDLSKITHLGIHSERYEGEVGLKRFLQQNRVSMDGVLAKKEALIKVGSFRDATRGKAEDYELWLNMLVSGLVLRGIDEKLSIIRKHPTSTMATTNISLGVIFMLERLFSNNPNIDPISYRKEIINWLSYSLSQTQNKKEIFQIYNIKNLKTFSIKINGINCIHSLRRILPMKVIKKLFYMYLESLDKKCSE